MSEEIRGPGNNNYSQNQDSTRSLEEEGEGGRREDNRKVKIKKIRTRHL